MKIRLIAAGLASVLAAGTAAAIPANANATAERSAGTKSLAKVLAADGNHFDQNWHDFDIVDKAVHAVLAAKPDSAVGILAQGNKRVTAFLPTDAAFQRLVKQLSGTTPHTERATYRAVTKVADVNTLETILLYHVVPGATITAAQAAKANGAKLETAAGKTLTVRVKHGTIRLVDKDPNARNARVIPGLADINKGNKQIAHGISQVLRPVDL